LLAKYVTVVEYKPIMSINTVSESVICWWVLCYWSKD